ncbi:DNA-binding FrmR family transcriptional regulator [Enterococcus sp. PF1-24]|uniref:metal-sensitive transcriptional regulator n=1 Tax=unclassified Enterococcus TaxID=2608891 RepID=UPI00247430E1|nr:MULTISPECIES: metal-sensitive transcriptional regulator [unclassified Enterococcus]MDH6363236.1 DNA-binding FrmR family transcriptional regulator [Enterococcus sp. PFB1-1]MDH6400463.1 DNA-binding FrmR family transcriptional regulator [Enterococcus sp. PF1-24]
MSHLPEHQTKNLVTRINRIEGQIGGIKKMIIEEQPYDQIIIQLNSARSAIQNISKILLEAQADHSLMNVAEGTALEDEMETLRKVLKQYTKMN